MPVSPQEFDDVDGDGRSRQVGAGESGTDERTQPTPQDDTSQPSGTNEGEMTAPQEEEEEVQHQRTLNAPDAPTKEEVAEHRANGHLPYRSWCRECVEAFGRTGS